MLGPRGQLRPEDQGALPYTSAVLHEVQRYITLLPHVPRCTAADTRLGGYLLPKVGPAPRVGQSWAAAHGPGLPGEQPGAHTTRSFAAPCGNL